MPLVAAAAILLLFGALLRPAHGAGFRGPNGYPGQNSGQVTLGVLRDEAIRNGAVCLDGSPPGACVCRLTLWALVMEVVVTRGAFSLSC